MKKFRKIAICLAFGMVIASLTAGCKGKTEETEAVSEQITETASETTTEVEVKSGTATITTKTYTSEDKTVSIALPDSSWENTKDSSGNLEFEGDGGTITVSHITGTSVASVQMPTSSEAVLENLSKAGKDTEKYEVTEFSQKKLGTKDQYFTVVKCTDTAESYVYSVGYDLVSDTEIYSVTGLVEEDNEEILEKIQTAVESFRVLKSSSSSSSTSQSESSQSESGATTGSTRTIYDSNGNAITVTLGANGVWSDANGKTYDLQDYGAMGSDGYWYTYQGSTSSSNSSTESTSSSETTSSENNNNVTGATSGFYDSDGNYISVTKDASGNWVDSYGTVYYFGDEGVTDSAGNYFPYNTGSGGSGGGESNGFYDSNGNYVVVTKDANGNWVDSSGNVYTFGDTGVTDAAGNFYPY